MTIVIDVGCARYGNTSSIEYLLREFSPDFLFGFDPNWKPKMFKPTDDLRTHIDITTAAAWTFDGETGFMRDGLNSCLSDHHSKVPCIDLARWIWEDMPAVRWADAARHRVILKIDAEAAEYDLLDHLIEQGADQLIHFLWVEWHPYGVPEPALRRRYIERRWRGGEIAEWTL